MSDDYCPHCGASLPPRAVACRECGSDFETGWSDEIDYYSVELPEDELKPAERGPFFKIVALICVLPLLGSAVYLIFGSLTSAVLLVLLAGSLLYGVKIEGTDEQ